METELPVGKKDYSFKSCSSCQSCMRLGLDGNLVDWKYWKCQRAGRYSTQINPVTGESRLALASGSEYCEGERTNLIAEDTCGPDGKYWTPVLQEVEE